MNLKWLSSLTPKKFEKKHFILIVILLIASFLRLYNVADTVQFLGDQGRDAMIVASIFKNLDPVFIGPVTSVGNMYLGPLYYYFMLPFLFITYPSPMGPVYAVAVLGIITVFLLYYFGKKMFSENIGLLAAGLYAVSTLVAYNTRFSWNPNPAPFVSLLMLFFVYKAVNKHPWYWILVVVCFSVLIQLHYVTILSGAGFGVIWILQAIHKYKKKETLQPLLQATALGILVCLFSLTPLFLFDLKHDGLNRKAFLNLFQKEDAFFKSSRESNIFQDVKNRSVLVTSEVFLGKQDEKVELITTFILLSTLVVITYQTLTNKKNIYNIYKQPEFIIFSFLITSIVGISLYKQTVYTHYISYLFPFSFLMLALVLNYYYKKHILGKLLVGIFLLAFLKFNYQYGMLILSSQGWTIAHVQGVAKTIEDRVQPGENYNIILLNGTGDLNGQNYRYFLHASEKPPVTEDKFGEIETLFIIDEVRAHAKVANLPIYEIVVFPNKEPVEVYQIPNGPEITVLRKDTN